MVMEMDASILCNFWDKFLMYGSLLHLFWEAMTSSSDVDIQMITFLNAYDVGSEGT